MNASEIIELVGSEISWELLQSGEPLTWYVHASHTSGDPETSCKFSEAGERLDYCVRRVANDVLKWQRDQGWPQFTGDSA